MSDPFVPPAQNHLSFGVALLTNITTPTKSNVGASTSSVSLFTSNGSARQRLIFNDDVSANLYVSFGSTASLTSYTVKVPAGGLFEFPVPVYSGVVSGIWDGTPTGNARVTEVA